jgi:beta-barrel assembly-enhancing protease
MFFEKFVRSAANIMAIAILICAMAFPASAGKPKKTPEQKDAELGAAYWQKYVHPNCIKDATMEEFVSAELQKVLSVKTEQTFSQYTICVVRDSEINAFALPGGYIAVNLGLLRFAIREGHEAWLLGVLAHEEVHTDERHMTSGRGKQIATGAALMGLNIFLAREHPYDSWRGMASNGTSLLANGVWAKVSRNHEGDGDGGSIETLKSLNYSLESFSEFFGRLAIMEAGRRRDYSIGSWLLRSHPELASREARMKKAAEGQDSTATLDSPEWDEFKGYFFKKDGNPPRPQQVRPGR